MFKILKKKMLSEKIVLMDILAPRVAGSCLPGQFIIIRPDEKGERIPLTICDYDAEKGTVTIVFQIVGASTAFMASFEEGDGFADFAGPLGKPSEFCFEPVEELKKQNIVFMAGGVGTAPVYPQVKWLHEHGVSADVIIGARNESLIILSEEMKKVAGNVYVTTDDGTMGRKGNVNDCLNFLINEEKKTYDKAIAIGPLIMMKFACILTKQLQIPTIVSLNPIMIDGTGMCGGCRVLVGNEVKFACVDGPEFDGHLVDFDACMKRQQLFKTEEGRAELRKREGDTHHGGCGLCE